MANKVSRIDGAVDLPGVDVNDFIEPFLEDCCLCRARKFSIIGEGKRNQTLVVGTSPMVRIYDKVREQLAKPDPAKLRYLVDHRWGGVVPDFATRVEFQLRRDDVKSIEFDGRAINSLEDYLECRTGLWSYLCNWFRLTKDPVDENHRDRAETLPLWQEVADAFAAWSSSPVQAVVRVKRTKSIDEKTLTSMIVGCSLSVCANDDSFDIKALKHSALRAILEGIQEHGEEELARRWWVKRQRELAAMPPAKDRKGLGRPKVISFDTWLAEKDAYRRAVEEAGGQMPFVFGDPLQFIDLKTIIGD